MFKQKNNISIWNRILPRNLPVRQFQLEIYQRP